MSDIDLQRIIDWHGHKAVTTVNKKKADMHSRYFEQLTQANKDKERMGKALDLMLKVIPTNWCDSLLTGDDKAIGEHPYGCPDIEALLKTIKNRQSEIALGFALSKALGEAEDN